MDITSCLLNYYIRNNDFVSSCDFIPHSINEGKIIYEVIRVVGGIPLFFEEHMLRFFNSISKSNYRINFTKKSLVLRIKALIEINKLEDGNIKFQFSFTNNNEEVFTAWVCPFLYPKKHYYTKGILTKTFVAQRHNPNIKIQNKKLASTINTIINENNIYEVLLVNEKNNITEGSRSNIFFVNNNNIYTPPISSILPGITRQKVIETATKLNIFCHEQNISASSISAFQGAFITGTSPKVLPILKINNILFETNHPTIQKIIDGYNRAVNNNIILFSWESLLQNIG